MAIISDLSGDLVEEILSRVPLKSLRSVRSTCKTWEALSKTLILGQKAVKKQFMAFTVIDYRICFFRFELQGIRNKAYNLADPFMEKISIPHYSQVKISQVYHCDGILLCVLKDTYKLLVWNPYLGQTRWLLPRPLKSLCSISGTYAIGYEYVNNKRNHKVLRFSINYFEGGTTKHLIDLFDFRSASWKVLDVNPILGVDLSDHKSVSLKGNTYFCCQEVGTEERNNFLLCFDFTTERFGPRLPLPQPLSFNHVTLSCVRDEKLALLYNYYEEMCETIVIWITTKIEPNAVSWIKFLTRGIKPHKGLLCDHWFCYNGRSFFIDEEKKAAVVFNIAPKTGCQMAYITGEDGYFRSVNMGEALYSWLNPQKIVLSSYVPSLVQLQV